MNAMTDDKVISGIEVIMKEYWDLPRLNNGEVEGYATQLLRRVRLGDSRTALDSYVSQVQTNLLQLPPSKVHSEIVDRVVALVKNSN
jgi:hypothetical protein